MAFQRWRSLVRVARLGPIDAEARVALDDVDRGDESRVRVGSGVAGRIATSDEGAIFDDLAPVDVESAFLREYAQ